MGLNRRDPSLPLDDEPETFQQKVVARQFVAGRGGRAEREDEGLFANCEALALAGARAQPEVLPGLDHRPNSYNADPSPLSFTSLMFGWLGK